MDFEKVYERLKENGQLHLLKFVEELNVLEREELYKQIEQLDFSLLDTLKNKDVVENRGRITPIEALTVHAIEHNKDEYYKVGLQAIREGKVGALLLAGGQGTRLGSDKPKGMLNIGETKELFIFEILIQNLLAVVKKAEAWIPLLVMTSDKTHSITVEFLREHKFFGYNEDYVTFFMQEMAPSVDYEGKIYLESKNRISLSPNGNGGCFSSMKHAGIFEKMKSQGVEWFNVFSVDNVLQKIADPYFIGAVIKENYVSGSKVVAKADPDERVGVLCLEDGRPSIVEYYEMTEEMRTLKDEDGVLQYNYGVILNYLFHLNELENIVNHRLPIHVAEKKIPYIDENGNPVSPETPNGYKFETLILDMIHLMDNCLPFEVVREREFAPIKNKVGVDSIETAKSLLKMNHIDL